MAVVTSQQDAAIRAMLHACEQHPNSDEVDMLIDRKLDSQTAVQLSEHCTTQNE